ncbi:odorant receptor 131-2-like [Melanotaenia boesemani]|uniref:odorant receptor 131-2-like n=1 Tax=Melanotaenia boesemani TaxID=1250792 RepID=UPI001C054F04|nr:odorant receptor 131-2-like [Melanotaenia boesemani]
MTTDGLWLGPSSAALWAWSNVSVQLQNNPSLLENVLTLCLITVATCVFLFINGTMLFTLRSKAVFRDTCRYILLYNLLFADTVQLLQSQVVFLLAFSKIRLTYPVCGSLVTLASLTTVISPLTLVVMSLERYVAVCYPLRHASIITIRNTAVAVVAVWVFSLVDSLIRVLLLLEFPFKDLDSLQIKDLCSNVAMLLSSASDHYDKSFTCFLFVAAGITIIYSFASVINAARSASTDKTLVHKARNTLLLHLLQLGLSLSSTIFNPVLVAISRTVERMVFIRTHKILYLLFILFPRSLSSLIYGLRDQTIRPVLVSHLCCRQKAVSSFVTFTRPS